MSTKATLSRRQERAFLRWLAGYELKARRELVTVEEHAARLAFKAGVRHGKKISNQKSKI